MAVLPDFVEKHTWDLSDGQQPLNENDISLIISIFSISQILFAPFNACIKNRMGSKNTIILGFIVLTLTTFLIGGMKFITSPRLFLWTSCILRFLQGAGDVILQITGYSIVTSAFSDNITKYISILEVWVALGLGLGPFIGTLIYQNSSYEMTMYGFGLMSLISTLACFVLLPDSLNYSFFKHEEDVTEE